MLTVIALSFPGRVSDGILWYRPLSNYEKLAVWAGNNTVENSIFVVPPDMSGFRFWSQRSVVNESKEGGEGLFDRNFSISWDQREDMLEAYETLTPAEVTSLKSTFHATYLVTQNTLAYPELKSYGNWHLYSI